MSFEVKDFDSERDGKLVAAVTLAAADLCAAEDTPRFAAYTEADRRAQYAAEVLFVTLGRLGLWPPPEGIDVEAAVATMEQVVLDNGAMRDPSV
jgi:hypothetical protein